MKGRGIFKNSKTKSILPIAGVLDEFKNFTDKNK